MCAVLGKYEKKLSLLDASKIQKYISRGFAYFSHTFCIQSSHQKGKVHSQKFAVAKCSKGPVRNARKRQVGVWGSELKLI